MEKIRLLLAEDETIIRMGLIKLLESNLNYFVVGEAQNGAELIEKYTKVNPDITLCDISMPIMSGLVASTKILQQDKAAKIILISMHEDEVFLLNAMKIGIAGYVSKFITEGELKYAIQTVYEGGKYFMGKSDAEIEQIKLRCRKKQNINQIEELTKREQQIAWMVADGMTSTEVSEELYISKRTVDNHRAAIREKLGGCKKSDMLEFLKKKKPL